MGTATPAAVQIDLTRVLELLQEHITGPLCETVFGEVRETERQRAWTLEALVQFWTAVILRAPRALSQALYETLEGREPLFPLVQATPEAFFQRCQNLRPAFFEEIFRRFTAGLVPDVPPRFAAELAPVCARFADLLVLDGSRLAAIAHRLKLLWDERAVVLPGCLLVLYDLGRGLCRTLLFSPDAAAGELTRAKTALEALARDTLLVADRLYCTAAFFAALGSRGCWGLTRRNRRLGLRKVRRLRKRRHQGGRLEDWLVQAGSGATAPVQALRYIRWRRGRRSYELLTSVLDPARLSAVEALALYPGRWTIERMYFDLKEVLNLNRVYPANPNAVAMQVYAAGVVYNALRVAQGEVAEAAAVAPEAISPAKFFPKMAAACHAYALFELWFWQTQRANPRRRLRKPALHARRFARVALDAIQVEVRQGPRRRRRFCAARRHWKSLAHVRGGRKMLKLT